MTSRSCTWSLPAILLLVAALPALLSGQERPSIVADILADRPNMSDPAQRAEVVDQLRRQEEQRKAAAVERARQRGLPIRLTGPENQVAELMDFQDDRPLYAVTTNRQAAISTAADETRIDLGVDGNGFTVGVWDGGAVRASHQEFVGRVNLIDNVSAITHATHVAGTIGAAGVTDSARGMSPAVIIDSYDWNSDKSEMTSRGASYPGEPGAIYLSNHSYGYISGWGRTDRLEWFGQGTTQTAVEGNFGKYNSFARDMDSLAHNLPYYLAFWAAGNDGTDNPKNGETVRISGSLVSYNSSVHPAGDGIYKSGYDTIGFESLAKNVITVGSVNDAVTFGVRDLNKASISSFSSWGPTDDGRIKPDLVANGASVYSTTAGGDSSYSSMSGTSMAAPNAAGSAQLLLSHFDQLFPGHVLRASTLKGLIIHTADDLGTEGPDYTFGWGLMNTRAAAARIAAHHASPGSHGIVEARLTSANPVHTYSFTWDGISPIRATLAWTDPAGAATTSSDNRTRRLVNDLDLVIQGPDGAIHEPYVMPYVGSWNASLLSAPATTGRNHTDNVEQVFVASPAAAGTYTAAVTVNGSLANDAQSYSLILSGSEETEASPPRITSTSPDSASSSVTTVTVLGSGFQTGANVRLRLPGDIDRRDGFSQVVTPEKITARIDTEEMAGGMWDIVVTNPDGQEAVESSAFAVAAPMWSENFEETVSGWSAGAAPGNTGWAVTDAKSRSPSHSLHAPGPASDTIDNLYSPVIDIPADASDLALSFWHAYEFASNDGGVIELSLDGGNWFDPTASGSGASFASGGYNSALSDKGKPGTRNPIGSRSAWSGTNVRFSEVVLKLSSSAYAGKKLQVRWRLAANNETASAGWHIDDVALQGAGTMSTPVPQIVVAPFADESPVTGASVNLYVEAENSDGSPGIVYTWTVNDSFDYPVSFDDNGTETANATTATFSQAGSFRFKVTARNAFNQSVSSELEVEVIATPAALLVEPSSAVVPLGGQFQFSATAVDQFEVSLDPQPALEWSVGAAAGTISAEGLFTAATEAGGPFQLTAAAGDLSGAAEVTLKAQDYADWQQVHFTTEELNDAESSGDLADPDRDGVYNLLEYALDGNPREASREILPRTNLEETPAGLQLVLTFSRSAAVADLHYLVLTSSDLVNWSSVPADFWQVESDGETETVTVREPVSENKGRFLRLQVERNGS